MRRYRLRFLAVAALVGGTAVGSSACGGNVTIEESEQGSADVAGAYAPPTPYMCQAFVPSGECAQCLESAVGACVELRAQCDASAECDGFRGCQFACEASDTCCESCSSSQPEGFVQYAEYIDCVVCDLCATPCEGLFPDFCPG